MHVINVCFWISMLVLVNSNEYCQEMVDEGKIILHTECIGKCCWGTNGCLGECQDSSHNCSSSEQTCSDCENSSDGGTSVQYCKFANSTHTYSSGLLYLEVCDTFVDNGDSGNFIRVESSDGLGRETSEHIPARQRIEIPYDTYPRWIRISISGSDGLCLVIVKWFEYASDLNSTEKQIRLDYYIWLDKPVQYDDYAYGGSTVAETFLYELAPSNVASWELVVEVCDQFDYGDTDELRIYSSTDIYLHTSGRFDTQVFTHTFTMRPRWVELFKTGKSDALCIQSVSFNGKKLGGDFWLSNPCKQRTFYNSATPIPCIGPAIRFNVLEDSERDEVLRLLDPASGADVTGSGTGLVQLLAEGKWFYVCGQMRLEEGTIACRTLGLSFVSASFHERYDNDSLFAEVNCNGFENSLDECTQQLYKDCNPADTSLLNCTYTSYKEWKDLRSSSILAQEAIASNDRDVAIAEAVMECNSRDDCGAFSVLPNAEAYWGELHTTSASIYDDEGSEFFLKNEESAKYVSGWQLVMVGCEASNAQLRVLTSRGEYFATRFDANHERVQYTFEHKPEWIRLDFPGLDQTRTNTNTCFSYVMGGEMLLKSGFWMAVSCDNMDSVVGDFECIVGEVFLEIQQLATKSLSTKHAYTFGDYNTICADTNGIIESAEECEVALTQLGMLNPSIDYDTNQEMFPPGCSYREAAGFVCPQGLTCPPERAYFNYNTEGNIRSDLRPACRAIQKTCINTPMWTDGANLTCLDYVQQEKNHSENPSLHNFPNENCCKGGKARRQVSFVEANNCMRIIESDVASLNIFELGVTDLEQYFGEFDWNGYSFIVDHFREGAYMDSKEIMLFRNRNNKLFSSGASADRDAYAILYEEGNWPNTISANWNSRDTICFRSYHEVHIPYKYCNTNDGLNHWVDEELNSVRPDLNWTSFHGNAACTDTYDLHICSEICASIDGCAFFSYPSEKIEQCPLCIIYKSCDVPQDYLKDSPLFSIYQWDAKLPRKNRLMEWLQTSDDTGWSTSPNGTLITGFYFNIINTAFTSVHNLEGATYVKSEDSDCVVNRTFWSGTNQDLFTAVCDFGEGYALNGIYREVEVDAYNGHISEFTQVRCCKAVSSIAHLSASFTEKSEKGYCYGHLITKYCNDIHAHGTNGCNITHSFPTDNTAAAILECKRLCNEYIECKSIAYDEMGQPACALYDNCCSKLIFDENFTSFSHSTCSSVPKSQSDCFLHDVSEDLKYSGITTCPHNTVLAGMMATNYQCQESLHCIDKFRCCHTKDSNPASPFLPESSIFPSLIPSVSPRITHVPSLSPTGKSTITIDNDKDNSTIAIFVSIGVLFLCMICCYIMVYYFGYCNEDENLKMIAEIESVEMASLTLKKSEVKSNRSEIYAGDVFFDTPGTDMMITNNFSGPLSYMVPVRSPRNVESPDVYSNTLQKHMTVPSFQSTMTMQSSHGDAESVYKIQRSQESSVKVVDEYDETVYYSKFLDGKYIKFESPVDDEEPKQMKIKKALLNEDDVELELDLESLIGEGHFGKIYLGEYREVQCAFKLVDFGSLSDFILEGDLFFSVSLHPMICRFYGIYAAPNNHRFLVMEYYKLGSVLDAMKKKQFDEYRKICICSDISKSLLHLRKENVIHADLGLRNFLLNITGETVRVALTDFGLSCYFPASKKVSQLAPRWASPHFMRSRIPTFESDLWACGCVFWEVFSDGQLPYPDLTQRQVINLLVTDRITPAVNLAWPLAEIMTKIFQESVDIKEVVKSIKCVRRDMKNSQNGDGDITLNDLWS